MLQSTADTMPEKFRSRQSLNNPRGKYIILCCKTYNKIIGLAAFSHIESQIFFALKMISGGHLVLPPA